MDRQAEAGVDGMREEQRAAALNAWILRQMAIAEGSKAAASAECAAGCDNAGIIHVARAHVAESAGALKRAAALRAGADAIEALTQIEEEADTEADCNDGEDGIADRPNLAMRVQMLARAALAKMGAPHA